MAPHMSALPQTLESLTRSKMRALEKQRSSYEDRKAFVLAEAEKQPDLVSRVRVILNGTQAIHPTASKDTTVGNIERWLDQHRFDPSITDGMLQQYEDELHSQLDAHNVLNMRWADLENWDWFAGDDGVPVLPRQQLNGKYRILMEEDVLQLIFVQYIGTRLCNMLKSKLKDFILSDSVWNWEVGPTLTAHDKERQLYYFDRPLRHGTAFQGGPKKVRKSDYLERYFLCQLPLKLTTLADGGAPYDDDDSDDGNSADEGSEYGWSSAQKGSSIEADRNTKQQLLRKVATEILIQRYIYGDAAVIQSGLRWYATGLPHSTIFAVVEYIGFSEKWIAFFRKYLASPLKLDSSSEERMPMGLRIRNRGVPMAHSSEELILFFMDLAVDQTTGLLLYRLHDDLWLCGEPSKCAQAWEVMARFAKVSGLEFNMSKTGSVYLSDNVDPALQSRLPNGPVTFGFLKLDPSGTWVIDQAQVDAHVTQLKAQLDKSDSVMVWIRTWNSCMGRFFRNTLGQPATCFGQSHADVILSSYRSMQETLFGGSSASVTQHLCQMVESRFGVSNIPDAFFYYLEELGDLGLRNPSISPFLARDSSQNSPQQHISNFLSAERKLHHILKKEFDDTPQTIRMARFARANDGVERRFVSRFERDAFISFEELTHAVPEPEGISFTMNVSNALSAALGSKKVRLNQEKRWILQLHAAEVLRNYGGVALVDKKYLPVGVMAMVKEKRIKRQMVL
ncbi:hypothetical protein BDV10DRAFT_184855 [Aspergillus recurvatus]